MQQLLEAPQDQHVDHVAVLFNAGTPLDSAPVVDATTPGVPATGNLLDSVGAPNGTNTVTSFLLPGSDTPVTAGTDPVPVVDPVTGIVTGTLLVNPDGSYIFDPAPGFTGPVPEVLVTVTGSDGQTVQVPLDLTVNPLLDDKNESTTLAAGQTYASNLLNNTDAPLGTNVSITSFTLPGSSVAYTPGPNPVTVYDPNTGKVTGTVTVNPNGDVTFTPAPGFAGQVPPISYTVDSSDGQVNPSVLDITVLPGMQTPSISYAAITRA